MPFKRIAAEVGVSVGSVFLWAGDIQLTEEQHAQNLRGPRGPVNAGRLREQAAKWGESCRAKRRAYQEQGRLRARGGDSLHLAGCMLYWAEGSKSRNALAFVNSDASMMLCFRRFLTDALNVPASQIRLRLNVYTGNGRSIEEVERYWLELLALPATCLRKHTVNHRPTSSSGRARNKLPYGVCTLVVHNTQVVQHVYGAIQEYGGFEEPAWLG
jgi:hypothetical protein